jgi:hypothetical protein
MASAGENVGLISQRERDIRPMFRDKDRDSMMSALNLFHCTHVAQNADAIRGTLRSGQMPCDGAWPDAM